MTDANTPANGHSLDAQSADITPAAANGTSGIGVPTGEETRSAPDPGGAGARQRPPGAASPAGWFPSPAGEAAPPVRNREPVRSGEPLPDAEPDPRPTSWYRIPGPLAPGGARRLPVTSPASAGTGLQGGTGQAGTGQARTGQARTGQARTGQSGQEGPGGHPAGPAPRWPLITQRGPRNIPVVGPTEPLRVRAGGPSTDASPGAARGADASLMPPRGDASPGAARGRATRPRVPSPAATRPRVPPAAACPARRASPAGSWRSAPGGIPAATGKPPPGAPRFPARGNRTPTPAAPTGQPRTYPALTPPARTPPTRTFPARMRPTSSRPIRTRSTRTRRTIPDRVPARYVTEAIRGADAPDAAALTGVDRCR